MKRFEVLLLTGVVAICVAAAATLLYALWSLSSAEDNQRDLASKFTGTVSLAQNVRDIQAHRDGAFPVFLIAADRLVLQEIGGLDREFDRALSTLRRSTRDRQALASIANIETERRRLLAVERPGVARRLAGEAPIDHRGLKMLDGLESSAAAMNLLISNILDHAKIGVGPLALDIAPCSLPALISSLLARFELLAEARGVLISSDVPPDLPAVDMDRMRIEQVVSNLLGNAIKFTPRGGRIALDAAIDGGSVCIRVVDTGRGMDAAQIEHVFDRHWQAAETASAGSGLGLAISKAIVEAHGGSITARTNVGKGMCFSFVLPLRQAYTVLP